MTRRIIGHPLTINSMDAVSKWKNKMGCALDAAFDNGALIDSRELKELSKAAETSFNEKAASIAKKEAQTASSNSIYPPTVTLKTANF